MPVDYAPYPGVVSDDPARIVRFWQAVEMFSPQALPKPDPRNHIVDVCPGEPMPWEQPLTSVPGKIWRHEVFGGVYELSKVRDVPVTHFGQDHPEASRAARPSPALTWISSPRTSPVA